MRFPRRETCPFSRRLIPPDNAQASNHGLGMEVVQGSKTGDHGGQGCRDHRIARVREMLLAVHAVIVDLGVKGCLYLACRAAEVDEAASRGDLVDDESVLPQPSRNLIDIR